MAIHVRDYDLQGADDEKVSALAKAEGRVMLFLDWFPSLLTPIDGETKTA
jgi:hypothetical protein